MSFDIPIPVSATTIVALLSAMLTSMLTLPPSLEYFTALDSRLYIIFSILSPSNHALMPRQCMFSSKVRCFCPNIGTMLRHVSWQNSPSRASLTLSCSLPACALRTSSIWRNIRVRRLMLLCMSDVWLRSSGCSLAMLSADAEITVSGVSSSWVMLVKMTAICRRFLVRRRSRYHFIAAYTPPMSIHIYIR